MRLTVSSSSPRSAHFESGIGFFDLRNTLSVLLSEFECLALGRLDFRPGFFPGLGLMLLCRNDDVRVGIESTIELRIDEGRGEYF